METDLEITMRCPTLFAAKCVWIEQHPWKTTRKNYLEITMKICDYLLPDVWVYGCVKQLLSGSEMLTLPFRV